MDDFLDDPPRGEPGASGPRFVAPALAVLILLAVLAFVALKPSNAPPPAEIASDPLLTLGRTLFLDRCASCHGQAGRGDGPIAKTLKSGRAGDFTASPWRFGDKPDDVRKIIAGGTPDGQMPGWGRIFSEEERDAAAAYVFFLGKRPVPEAFRPKKAGGG